MTPEQYRRVGELYDAATSLTPEARRAFLNDACAGDETLRHEVESLLQAHEQADGFLVEKMADAVAELAAPTSSLVGQRISHYQMLVPLGKGGMGEVYLAEDTQLGRKVALKLLPAGLAADEEARRRFTREARAASALAHPHICTIHEIGEDNGRRFIVMEYVEGETLAAKLKRERLRVEEALELAAQMADALAEAHAHQIIHRDIKPANILITPRGQAKVLDFGLAKFMQEPSLPDSAANTASLLSTPGQVMGTVPYMSPEQVRGERLDARTDIFSFGSMLYEMLSGRQPFAAKSAAETMSAILTKEPEPLPEVAPEVEQVVRRCLAKKCEQRYPSARELLRDLDQLKSGSFAVTRTLPTDSHAQSPHTWAGNTTAMSVMKGRARWLAVAAVVAVLLTAVLLYWRVNRAPLAGLSEIKSLAVLPLENLSGDPAQDYFADGMTESLIAGLAKVGALRVSPRTSVLQYQKARKPLADIARELNVDAVIEGSVQRFGEQVKITARLIHAPSERHLWDETYERNLRDALALQNEIARAVIQQVQIKLTPQEQTQMASVGPVNPAAYDDYLRGKFYANRQNKADNETGIKMLERAVAADPNFAAAQAELAQVYVWRFFLFTPGEKQWEEKAFVAVQKALSLDPNLAVAHAARGRLLWTPAYRFPHEQAIQEYQRALALDPHSDEAQNQLALVYNHIGMFDLALQELQKAVVANPTNHLAAFRIGETMLFQGKYEQALPALRQIPRAANPAKVGSILARTLMHLGQRDEAAAVAEESLKNYPDDTDVGLFHGIQALLAALAGEEQKAEGKIRVITHGFEKPPKGFPNPHALC
jgi:TolB-like protein/predicted Ser/Thr protein kinase/Flp pilus assembly protein TadD